MNHTDMEIGWNFLSDYLESYNKVLAGQTPTIYNSPNVVELDTGNFYREEQNESYEDITKLKNVWEEKSSKKEKQNDR